MIVSDVLNVRTIVFDLRVRNISGIVLGRSLACLVFLEARKAREGGELHFWEKIGITRGELHALAPPKKKKCHS